MYTLQGAILRSPKQLTLEGNIVISVGLFGHSGDDDVWKPGVKEMLDDMHLRKTFADDTVLIRYLLHVFGTLQVLVVHMKSFF